jgi:hypothetical protein
VAAALPIRRKTRRLVFPLLHPNQCASTSTRTRQAIPTIEANWPVTRLGVAGRDRWPVSVLLRGGRGSVASEGEAMGQQLRKAALLAATERTRRERRGADGVSRAVPIEVQDHQAFENPRSSWCRGATRGFGRSAHIHRSQRRLRNSVLCERFRCMGGPGYADPAVPSVVRSRRRGADLEVGLEVY